MQIKDMKVGQVVKTDGCGYIFYLAKDALICLKHETEYLTNSIQEMDIWGHIYCKPISYELPLVTNRLTYKETLLNDGKYIMYSDEHKTGHELAVFCGVMFVKWHTVKNFKKHDGSFDRPEYSFEKTNEKIIIG